MDETEEPRQTAIAPGIAAMLQEPETPLGIYIVPESGNQPRQVVVTELLQRLGALENGQIQMAGDIRAVLPLGEHALHDACYLAAGRRMQTVLLEAAAEVERLRSGNDQALWRLEDRLREAALLPDKMEVREVPE